jgi:hypothetical protein
MLFFIQNDFYTSKYNRLFPNVKTIVNRENILLYIFFWVFPRRQIKFCRRFETLCQIQNTAKIWNQENIHYVRHVKHAARGPQVMCGPHDNTNVTHMALGGPSVWHAWSRAHRGIRTAVEVSNPHTQKGSTVRSDKRWKHAEKSTLGVPGLTDTAATHCQTLQISTLVTFI